jgi:hypothetical protein
MVLRRWHAAGMSFTVQPVPTCTHCACCAGPGRRQLRKRPDSGGAPGALAGAPEQGVLSTGSPLCARDQHVLGWWGLHHAVALLVPSWWGVVANSPSFCSQLPACSVSRRLCFLPYGLPLPQVWECTALSRGHDAQPACTTSNAWQEGITCMLRAAWLESSATLSPTSMPPWP